MGVIKFFKDDWSTSSNNGCSNHSAQCESEDERGISLVQGNPNPRHFTIVRAIELGRYAVLEVHYPDCTNFEGKKLLVFEDIPLTTLRRKSVLDPHFSQSKHAPIARFVPTKEGWEMAKKFFTML
ncbi:MAG: Caulobacter phage CcrPW [Candidatus Parcubacteria bacterium]